MATIRALRAGCSSLHTFLRPGGPGNGPYCRRGMGMVFTKKQYLVDHCQFLLRNHKFIVFCQSADGTIRSRPREIRVERKLRFFQIHTRAIRKEFVNRDVKPFAGIFDGPTTMVYPYDDPDTDEIRFFDPHEYSVLFEKDRRGHPKLKYMVLGGKWEDKLLHADAVENFVTVTDMERRGQLVRVLNTPPQTLVKTLGALPMQLIRVLEQAAKMSSGD